MLEHAEWGNSLMRPQKLGWWRWRWPVGCRFFMFSACSTTSRLFLAG